jgi:predicted GTPase
MDPVNDNYDCLHTDESAYDFIVDLTRPTDILEKSRGYQLIFPNGKSAYDDKIRLQNQRRTWFIINIVGRYNVGKTYVLRLLAGINLGHSFVERTQGVSVSLPTPVNNEQPMIALIDTAGSRTPVCFDTNTFSNLAYEKQISDSFIQEIALNSAEVFVYVINQLTLDDELGLKKLYKRLIVRTFILNSSLHFRKNL